MFSINSFMAHSKQVISASVDGIVNSTAFICSATFENHLTPCRVLIEHAEGEPVPTNFGILKSMIETSEHSLSEISIDGCEQYMSDGTGYVTIEEYL